MISNKAQKEIKVKSSERRLSTQCNYSIFMTLSMNFLKYKDIYKVSQELVNRNSISKEKNYSIIVIRLALYIFIEIQRKNTKKQIAINQMVKWFNRQLNDCLTLKYGYKGKEFQKKAQKKLFNILKVFQKVFRQENLQDFQNTKNILLQLYDLKPNKPYSKTHQKCAKDLATTILGVMSQGQNYVHSCLYQNQKSIKSDKTIISLIQGNVENNSKISIESFELDYQCLKSKQNLSEQMMSQQSQMEDLKLQNSAESSLLQANVDLKYFLAPEQPFITQDLPELQVDEQDRSFNTLDGIMKINSQETYPGAWDAIQFQN